MSLRIVAITPLAALAFLVVGGPVAYADANPNNRGHHYGQLKHHRVPPPHPTPAPTPGPVTAPTPAAHATAPAANVTLHANDQAATALQSSVTPSPLADRIPTASASAPASTYPEWLVLLILPLLLAVWVIALARLAGIAAGGARRAPVASSATA